jgi:hypothetical protein
MKTRRHLLTASAVDLAFSGAGLVPFGLAQLGGRTARIVVRYPAMRGGDLSAD